MAKATITAKFSNGHTDVYKGTREVKAAWMITNATTGEVYMSGHSLDRAKAQKTAEGNTSYCLSRALGRYLKGDSMRPTRYASQIVYHNGLARKEGFKDWKEAHLAYKAEAEIARRNLKIEVIDL